MPGLCTPTTLLEVNGQITALVWPADGGAEIQVIASISMRFIWD